MGTFKNHITTAGSRIGNTIATPPRIMGEAFNAVMNIPRQWFSGMQNAAEVARQTVDALKDNFLNFWNVKGKWYQRLSKGAINFASAITRRPFMIAGAGVLSWLNQAAWQPFKKLLYTPGKMFKGMWKGTRILSKKTWFGFQIYDTHETKWDTRVNKFREKNIWFFGTTATMPSNDIKEKPEKKKEKIHPKQDTKPDQKPNPQPTKDKKEKSLDSDNSSWTIPSTSKDSLHDTPKSIDEMKKQDNEKAIAKDKAENDAKERKNLDRKEKAKQEKIFQNLLNNDMTIDGVEARGKKNNKWDTIDQILIVVKKEYPAMAGYIEEEIIAKQQSKTTA